MKPLGFKMLTPILYPVINKTRYVHLTLHWAAGV